MPIPLAKRVLDLLVSVLGLILGSPVMLLLSVAVWTSMGSPVLFRQTRPGLDGLPFTMYKFRTMRDAWDENRQPLPDSARLTRLGTFMRRTSLDELPELWNVLKGEMSLVGPRPLRMEYLPLYTKQQMRRHNVRPGITGWAQIHGRNACTWEERFDRDIWYVDNWSFMLDLKILWRTIWKVLGRDGIAAQGHATMPAFQGSPRGEESK